MDYIIFSLLMILILIPTIECKSQRKQEKRVKEICEEIINKEKK